MITSPSGVETKANGSGWHRFFAERRDSSDSVGSAVLLPASDVVGDVVLEFDVPLKTED
jgi:hypothetical protein